jgi:hypothetical protein
LSSILRVPIANSGRRANHRAIGNGRARDVGPRARRAARAFRATVGRRCEDSKFDFHGFFRAPLRIGKNDRQGPVLATQSSTSFHEPLLLDDQYLNWNYTRAQEKAWAEMFFSYGNAQVTGTLSVTAYNFDDWERIADAQFGISQGWLTVNPDPGWDNVRVQWRVGAFTARYGMAGKYDAGPYDTYVIGRAHQMGELLKAEFDVAGGEVTLVRLFKFQSKKIELPFGNTRGGRRRGGGRSRSRHRRTPTDDGMERSGLGRSGEHTPNHCAANADRC